MLSPIPRKRDILIDSCRHLPVGIRNFSLHKYLLFEFARCHVSELVGGITGMVINLGVELINQNQVVVVNLLALKILFNS